MLASRRLSSALRVAVGTWLLAMGPATEAAGEPPMTPDCGLTAGPTQAIAAVIDGGSVRLDDGRVLRLAGIRAPEASDAAGLDGEWPPATAAHAALVALVGGRSVALAYAGARADRYGRVLAHAFLRVDDMPVWVQGRMLADGHARVDSSPDDNACSTLLLAHEQAARQRGIGLWSHAAYQVRSANQPAELDRYVGTYQLVLGRIARISGSRNLVFAELASTQVRPSESGRRREAAFRVVWQQRLQPTDKEGRAPAVGQEVLVRGWLERRAGPQIEIISAAALEIVGGAAEGSASEGVARHDGKQQRRRWPRREDKRPDEKRPAAEPPGAR